MSEVVPLLRIQMTHLAPHFPRSLAQPLVDDQSVVSSFIYVIRNGMMWKHARFACGPYKTLYNRSLCSNPMDISERVFAALSADVGIPDQLIDDSTHLKPDRAAASLAQKGADYAGSAAHRAC